MYQSRWADPLPRKDDSKAVSPAQLNVEHTTSATPARPTSTSALSAEAPDFAPLPTDPPPDVSSADTFAGTGADPNDLFDDVVPVEESMRIRSDDDLFNDDFTPAPEPVVAQAVPQPNPLLNRELSSRGGRGRDDGNVTKGWGKGRGSQYAGKETQGQSSTAQSVQNSTDNNTQVHQDNAPENAPTGPRKENVPAVRGDRHATGGIKKPKLTEDELAEKMARIQIKNASLAAAHARAEADAASFAERETKAKQVSDQRRKEERRDRQQMMGEREKNRLRKLKAIGGREWDAEKHEDDFGKGGRFDKHGGFAGDQQDYTDGREYLYQEPRGNSRGGRGGRARQGDRRREEAPPKQEDFPALPPTTKDTTGKSLKDSTPPELANASAHASWADQMESPAVT